MSTQTITTAGAPAGKSVDWTKFFGPEAFRSPIALAAILAILVGFTSQVAHWPYDWWFPVALAAVLVLAGRVYWYEDSKEHPLSSWRTWPTLVVLWVVDSLVVFALATGATFVATAGTSSSLQPASHERTERTLGPPEEPSVGFRRLADPSLY